jgi:ureidoacrylate peracid hydrolase
VSNSVVADSTMRRRVCSARSICCETTAREAAQHDFRVVFLSDGTATKEMNGVSAQDLQRATLASLGMVFAQIATVAQVSERLRAAAAPPVAVPAAAANTVS